MIYQAITNMNAIFKVSSRGAKKIPSLRSEQAWRSFVASETKQSHQLNGIATPLRARNDNVKEFFTFILNKIDKLSKTRQTQ